MSNWNAVPVEPEISDGNAPAARSDTLGDFTLRVLWIFTYAILIWVFRLLRRIETFRLPIANKRTESR